MGKLELVAIFRLLRSLHTASDSLEQKAETVTGKDADWALPQYQVEYQSLNRSNSQLTHSTRFSSVPSAVNPAAETTCISARRLKRPVKTIRELFFRGVTGSGAKDSTLIVVPDPDGSKADRNTCLDTPT